MIKKRTKHVPLDISHLVPKGPIYMQRWFIPAVLGLTILFLISWAGH